jgi:hypothetical protein
MIDPVPQNLLKHLLTEGVEIPFFAGTKAPALRELPIEVD